MPRDTQYITNQWTNPTTGWTFELRVTPADDTDYFIVPTTLTETIPDDVITDFSQIEVAIDDVPYGLANPAKWTVTMDLAPLDRSGITSLGDLAKYVLYPSVPIMSSWLGIPDVPVFMSNLWELYTDFGSGGGLELAFQGIQKRTPSAELKLTNIDGLGEQTSVGLEVELVHIGHYVAELTRPEFIGSYLRSKAYTATRHTYGALYDDGFRVHGFGQYVGPTHNNLHLMTVRVVYEAIESAATVLLKHLLRNGSAYMNIEEPHSPTYGGVTFYENDETENQIRGAAISANGHLDDLYIIAYTSSSENPVTTVADRNGGWGWDDGGENGLFAFTNLWEMLKSWAANFFCTIQPCTPRAAPFHQLHFVTKRLFDSTLTATVDAENFADNTTSAVISANAISAAVVLSSGSSGDDFPEVRIDGGRGTDNERNLTAELGQHNTPLYLANFDDLSVGVGWLVGSDIIYIGQRFFSDFSRLYHKKATALDTDGFAFRLPHPEPKIATAVGDVYGTAAAALAKMPSLVNWVGVEIETYVKELKTAVWSTQANSTLQAAIATAAYDLFSRDSQFTINVAIDDNAIAAAWFGAAGIGDKEITLELSMISGLAMFTAYGSKAYPLELSLDISTGLIEAEFFVLGNDAPPT